MKFETLGEWCKWLEKNFSPEVMIPGLPVIIRMDGNNFSTWTKNFNKPFDGQFNQMMRSVTCQLVQETNAVIGYTQSDEITLILYSADREKDIYNAGKKQKILSKLTSKLTTLFESERIMRFPDHTAAHFDCRIYQCPTLDDAVAQLIWRENDASKNSILMLGGAYYSPKQLFKKNTKEIQEMLFSEHGINWNNLEPHFKRGTYFARRKYFRKLNERELAELPLLHNARKDPDLEVELSKIEQLDVEPINKITNKVEWVFEGATPIYAKPE